MTPVGFEPTPLRNGALSHRLRPLGQSVLVYNLISCTKHNLAQLGSQLGLQDQWAITSQKTNSEHLPAEQQPATAEILQAIALAMHTAANHTESAEQLRAAYLGTCGGPGYNFHGGAPPTDANLRWYSCATSSGTCGI